MDPRQTWSPPVPGAQRPLDPDAQVDLLLDRIQVPFAVQAAAGALGLAGLLVMALGAQNMLLIRWRGVYAFVPLLFVAAGVGSAAVAAKLLRARGWAHLAALAISIVLTVATGAWFVFTVLRGLLSLLAFGCVGMCLVAVVAVAVSTGPFEQVTTARRRLRELGHDVDL
jgi:hypothetical protein